MCSSSSREVHFDKRLVGLDEVGDRVELAFADGTRVATDLVIGADGVHSAVRDLIIGPDKPIHKGRIAYRSVYDASRLPDPAVVGDSRTKWWGTARHIVIYFTAKDRTQLYFVTSVPESIDWLTEESWSATGDVNELREAYAGFHSDVIAVLDACPNCHKWAILEREPLATWSSRRVVLLGDACHPSGRTRFPTLRLGHPSSDRSRKRPADPARPISGTVASRKDAFLLSWVGSSPLSGVWRPSRRPSTTDSRVGRRIPELLAHAEAL